MRTTCRIFCRRSYKLIFNLYAGLDGQAATHQRNEEIQTLVNI